MNQPIATIRYRSRRLESTLPAFRLCGCAGFALAFLQSLFLAEHLGLSSLPLVGVTGIVILTFLALTMATKIIAGKEHIIYYHHEIAVVVATALFLRTTGQPVLRYLDITVVGLGLFLACGRIGCLLVGCCHGRPWNWGIVYGNKQVDTDFPHCLAGVRLFPIQAVESFFALCLMGAGLTVTLKGYAPGTALGLYVLLYAVARFCFEFARGDAVRPYLWGFSEAQWTSLVLVVIEVLAERSRLMPHYRWHVLVPLLLFSSVLMVSAKRYWDKIRRFQLLHPRHIREFAEAVRLADGTLCSSLRGHSPSPPLGVPVIHVAQTSLGIRVSCGEIWKGDQRVRHYTLSDQTGSLTPHAVGVLARLIARLRGDSTVYQVRTGKFGVFHLLCETTSTAADDLARSPATREAGSRLCRS